MWERILLNLVSLVLALGALGMAFWILLTGQIQSQGMDALFLLVVCLLAAFVFSFSPAREIRRGLLRDLLGLLRSRLPQVKKEKDSESSLQRTA